MDHRLMGEKWAATFHPGFGAAEPGPPPSALRPCNCGHSEMAHESGICFFCRCGGFEDEPEFLRETGD
jgi:hypothetical protein